MGTDVTLVASSAAATAAARTWRTNATLLEEGTRTMRESAAALPTELHTQDLKRRRDLDEWLLKEFLACV